MGGRRKGDWFCSGEARGAILEDGGDGGAEGIDVGAGDAGDGDAAGVDDVDGVIVAQAVDLFFGEAGEAEHAALVGDEGEIHLGGFGGHGVDELFAHGIDAGAHGGDVFGPDGAEVGIPEDGGDEAGAMGGRIGVIDADAEFGVAHGFAGGIGCLGDDGHGADALVVEAEVFGEAGGDEHFHAGFGEGAKSEGILLDAVAEALVGEVEEGEESAIDGDGGEFLPLLGGGVFAGGIVTAGVEEDDVAGGDLPEGGDHVVEGEFASGLIVVGIGGEFDAGGGEDTLVVSPGGVAHPEPCLGEGALDEIAGDAEASGAAGGLGGEGAAGMREIAFFTEEKIDDGVIVFGEAGHGEVATAGRGDVGDDSFGAEDGFEGGCFSFVVDVDAGAEVDFTGMGILVERFGEAEDRIGRGGFDGFEHGNLVGRLMGRLAGWLICQAIERMAVFWLRTTFFRGDRGRFWCGRRGRGRRSGR